MSKFIVCKTTGKSEQSYFLEMDNKLYFLFKQDYRVSNKEYYAKGVNVNDAIDFSKTQLTPTAQTSLYKQNEAWYYIDESTYPHRKGK